MKSKHIFQHRLTKTFGFAFILLMLACSKDDDGPRIILGQLRVENPELCSSSTGFGGAYDIIIPYSGTQDDTLKDILFNATYEDGYVDEGVQKKFQGFKMQDDQGELRWGGVCLNFGPYEWLDFEIRVETMDGRISNASSIRLDRTDFDNLTNTEPSL